MSIAKSPEPSAGQPKISDVVVRTLGSSTGPLTVLETGARMSIRSHQNEYVSVYFCPPEADGRFPSRCTPTKPGPGFSARTKLNLALTRKYGLDVKLSLRRRYTRCRASFDSNIFAGGRMKDIYVGIVPVSYLSPAPDVLRLKFNSTGLNKTDAGELNFREK